MKKFFISKNYRDRYTASSKAKLDCETIIQSLGYKNIGLTPTYFKNKYISRIKSILSNVIAFCRMPKYGIAFLQYPVYAYNRQILLAQRKHNKVITIIHDLNYLRGASVFNDKSYLEKSDVLIVHTNKMQEWCKSNLVNKNIIVLGIFDYLNKSSEVLKSDNFNHRNITVAFAGNLEKSSFIDKLSFKNIKFELFGIGIEKRNLNKCCVYKGCFPPDKLSQYISSSFGLVWDGDSMDKCSGVIGEYLKYIAPHKLSMYLSTGIPVIVWEFSAMAHFVTINKVGIAIKSLACLEIELCKLTEEDYQNFKKNAEKIKNKLQNGFFLKHAIISAEKCL